MGGKELAKILHFYGLLDAGSEFKIVCPFHEDINPSMLINLAGGNFHCFGCGISGDAFTFVRKLNKKLDDLDALKLYFKILKSKEVRRLKFDRQKKEKPTDKQALVEAEDYYFGLKTINWIKSDLPEKDYMVKRGFKASTLNKCKAKLTYNQNYPIVFPMFDLGTFKGWVCRATTKKVEQKRKYLYNTGFSRSNTLVGDYNAKVVVLVEGYMDRLKLLELGLDKVAAILGWKVTEQQITKLKEQGIEYIISALDNDDCGEKGTKYLQKFFKVIRFQYPAGVKDPGDLTKEQFDIAYNKTKKLFRGTKENGKVKEVRKSNQRHQGPDKKVRVK